MKKYTFELLQNYKKYSANEMLLQSHIFYEAIKTRRSVRDFSDKQVAEDVIINCIKAAGTAPSGANLQPWHFVIIKDSQIKKEIRIAAELEEKEFYNGRAPKEWLAALAPLGTNEHKQFLETAPYLIAIFSKSFDVLEDGSQQKNYYAAESTGIACGFLINALHHSGLASLTHTPSPMNFLNKILNRPNNERPFLLLVTGYAADGVKVPVIKKKSIEDITTII
ncbi:MAG: nitroreductase family protein [Ignavibacteriaceae bacterium]|nr:nitroreductase family protein [Ignavibacteriaceae bacterium]